MGMRAQKAHMAKIVRKKSNKKDQLSDMQVKHNIPGLFPHTIKWGIIPIYRRFAKRLKAS